jgi:hypothetical protein
MKMIKHLALAAALALAMITAASAQNQNQTTFRDAGGRTTGTATAPRR